MHKPSTNDNARFRFKLLASVAGIFAAATGVAAAETPGPLIRDIAAQSGSGGDQLVRDVAPQIVIAAPGTPTTARDPVNVTGVGQMIIDEQNGFIGLCTGTLINPRTVIFAAHCVNERAASAYGQNSGGQPIGFGFSNNNNAAGNSAFGIWLGNYATATSRFMYDANYVAYNPLSLDPNAGGGAGGAGGFLFGDVAMASLDTPAANVPTWALLFSALKAPTTVGAAGTGYHVTIDGYGNNGTGITGSTGGIDFRRRLAENFIGGLTSLDAFENWLFGGAGASNPQNLYFMDFDDPRRGTATPPSAFDFNAWRDNALPNEGITASGDSGGPLIVDQTFARQVVVGVLSGGYTRFFNGQPANGYGTVSFYQPLYLYWDWIAANNPYHYVSAVAGNGAWTDPTHWVTNLDPNYQIINGSGQLVNGVPTNLGVGNALDVGSRFGQSCFQSGGISDCLDHKTGIETVDARPIGTGGVQNDMGSASIADLNGTGPSNDAAYVSMASLNRDDVERTAQDAVNVLEPLALPTATLANGLPGATNFVPNNNDGNRLTSTAPRYFDVTLSATGTTTLSSAVTVDRFTIAGAGARLDIAAAGSLTSLMAVNQIAGTMNVNGALVSPGDYFLLAGLLGGTGTITAPFTTNVLGSIAPGTVGTIGTLTFNGNLILSSGGAYLVDLGPNHTADRLQINGAANLGGALGFAPIGGYTIRNGDTFTILNATGGLSGTQFVTPTAISAILRPQVTYSATAVTLAIQAGLYANVVNSADPVQVAFANLLDQNRGQQGNYPGLYGPLDMANTATVQATLHSMAPAEESTLQSIGSSMLDTMGNFIDDRLANLNPDAMDGSVALLANPIQLAELDNLGLGMAGASLTDAGDTGGGTVLQHRLPAGMRAFVAGGYQNGDSASMTGIPAGGRDQLNGYYVALGLESRMGDHATLGAAISYSKMDGDAAFGGQTAKGTLIQATAYGNVDLGGAAMLDGQLSVGGLETRTRRSVVLGTDVYQLRADDDPMALNAEVGISKELDLGALTLTPRAAVRASRISFDTVTETGGPPAMTYYRETAESMQGRFGLTLAGNSDAFKPYLTATYVNDFDDSPASFGANFAGGVGAPAIFALNGDDTSWTEIGVGLQVHTRGIEISLGAETTAGREDVDIESFRGSATFHF